MSDDTSTPTTDEAAQIIARLLSVCTDEWQRKNLNCVGVALSWLKAHDHPTLWLPANVRDMMEAHSVTGG